MYTGARSVRALIRLAQFRCASKDWKQSVLQVHRSGFNPSRDLFWNTGNVVESSGSAVVVDVDVNAKYTESGKPEKQRTLLTCAHVVANSRFLWIDSKSGANHGVGTSVPLKVIATAHEIDLALLTPDLGPDTDAATRELVDRFFEEQLAPAQLAEELPKRGEKCVVVGFPGGGSTLCVTSGVVSRVEGVHYAHSCGSHLAIQVDAAVNGGNSGGVLADTKSDAVTGIVHQGFSGSDYQNNGSAIPTNVIRLFLDAVEKGDLQTPEMNEWITDFGLPTWIPAWSAQPLLDDPLLREKLGVPNGEWAQAGVVLTRLSKASNAYRQGKVKEGDVLLQVDGHTVSNAGMVTLEGVENPVFVRILTALKKPGDLMKFKLWRPSEQRIVDVELEAERVNQFALNYEHDRPSSWACIGGFLFTRLSLPFVSSRVTQNDRNLWPFLHDLSIMRQKFESTPSPDENNPRYAPHKYEAVILNRVLPHQTNQAHGARELSFLETLDGVPVFNMRHLIDMLIERGQKGAQFVDFGFEGGYLTRLNLRDALAADAELMQRYNMPSMCSEHLMPPTPE